MLHAATIFWCVHCVIKNCEDCPIMLTLMPPHDAFASLLCLKLHWHTVSRVIFPEVQIILTEEQSASAENLSILKFPTITCLP